MNFSDYLAAFRNRRMAATLLLGFASGLPLALTLSPLQAWMATVHVSLKTIGLFSLVGLPYTLKFLWAPVMDRYAPPFLGRRRGWILVAQALIAAVVFLMASVDPAAHPGLLALMTLLLTFASASQDIVVDAYRADVLPERERGLGSATYVLGYRVAMLVAGALALILSDQIGWPNTYRTMAVVMLLSTCGTFIGPEPAVPAEAPRTLAKAVFEPLREFLSRGGAWQLLLLVVAYKLGDAFATSLNTAFLKQIGFTSTQIGAISKVGGLLSLMAGSFVGGTLMVRLGLYRSLLGFGLAQALTILPFLWLASAGRDFAVMTFAICAENFGSGLGTTAFVAFLMALCNRRYSATQFALLSALAAIGRVFVGPAAGALAAAVGWSGFFAVAFATCLPGLLLLRALKRRVVAMQGD